MRDTNRRRLSRRQPMRQAVKEQRLAGHGLEGHGREAVHVVARVRRRTADCVGTGEGGRQSAVPGPRGADAQADEVDELRVAIKAAEPAPRDHHIGKLDVAVDKAGLVLRAQSGSDLAHPAWNMHGQGRRARLRLEQGLQRVAIDPRCHLVPPVVLAAVFDQRDQPGMGGNLYQSRERLGIEGGGELPWHQLHRHNRLLDGIFASGFVHGAPHRAHLTGMYFLDEPEACTDARRGGLLRRQLDCAVTAWTGRGFSRLAGFRFLGTQPESGDQWLGDKGACLLEADFLEGIFVGIGTPGTLQPGREAIVRRATLLPPPLQPVLPLFGHCSPPGKTGPSPPRDWPARRRECVRAPQRDPTNGPLPCLCDSALGLASYKRGRDQG